MKMRFSVEGMACSACSAHVEKTVAALPGVDRVSVNLLTGSMEVEGKIGAEQVAEAVTAQGYAAKALGDGREAAAGREKRARREEDRRRREEQKKQKAIEGRFRLAWSFGCMLPLMYISMFEMYGKWLGLPAPAWIQVAFGGMENAMVLGLTQLLLTLPVLLANRSFFQKGLAALWRRRPNMDSLVAIGSGAAFLYGIWALYFIAYGLGHGDMELVHRYAHDLYFESAAMILALIALGKYLEGRSKAKTGADIEALLRLSPPKALVLDDQGREMEIDTWDLEEGQVFLVKPGALIPADGVVLEGHCSMDESAMTGESLPVDKEPGDKVFTASVNLSGFVRCRATRVGEDTALARIVALVEEAASKKAPIARLADTISGIFVPAVMAISLLSGLVWLLAGAGVEFALSTAIAVLVISCPCALGLATPVAIMVGAGVGARRGVLARSGEALQRASGIDMVVLDKTGTVTQGRMRLKQAWVLHEDMDREEILSMAALLEARSEHPIAKAVVEAAPDPGEDWQVLDFASVPGRGISGTLALGQGEQVQRRLRLWIGNKAYMQEEAGIDAKALAAAEALAMEVSAGGDSPLYIGGEAKVWAVLAIGDSIKEDSAAAIAFWKRQGKKVVMLTGDCQASAQAVGEAVGVDQVVAQALPQDKEAFIRSAQAQGRRVAMIGDGINDAPALAAAELGVAIGAGTDVAIESAQMVLVNSRLEDAAMAMELGRAVMRNIKQNLFWAFFYNMIGIPLAAGVFYPAFSLRLSPMFGAAAMSLSSLFVVGNALRLRGFSFSLGGERRRA